MDFSPDQHLRDDPEGAASQIASHILLTRQVEPDKTWLVVEGAADDKLFDRFIDLHGARLACAFGRKAVLEVSERLARFSRRDGFVGVVDLDFDGVDGVSRASSPVFATDTHDLETMCLASDHALDAVLAEFCDRKLRREFEAASGRSVRQATLAAARELGFVRLASLKRRLGLRVAAWSHQTHYPAFLEGLTVNRENVLAFLGTTPTVSQDGTERTCSSDEIEVLRATLSELEAAHAGRDTLLVACGHDACKILAASIGPERTLGGSREISPWLIEQGLRLAYPEYVFVSTRLFTELQAWQLSNREWKLLRE